MIELVLNVIKIYTADAIGDLSQITSQDPTGGKAGNQLIPFIGSNIINPMLVVLAIISIAFLVKAGYDYVMSGGGSVDGAKKTVQYSIMGLVLAFTSYSIINFVIGRLTGSSQFSSNPEVGGFIHGSGLLQTPLFDIINNLFSLAMIGISVVSVAFLINAGYQYILGKGSVDKAKQSIQYTIVGIIIAAMALSIQQFVLKQLGIGQDIINPEDQGSVIKNDPFVKDSLQDTTRKLINFSITLSAVVAVAYIIRAGYGYIMGGSENVDKNKKMLTYAVIGLIIILISGAIVNFVTDTLVAVTPTP